MDLCAFSAFLMVSDFLALFPFRPLTDLTRGFFPLGSFAPWLICSLADSLLCLADPLTASWLVRFLIMWTV